MIKHKFHLVNIPHSCDKTLSIHRCMPVGTDDQWYSFNLDPDELDELHRILDIGMGDCDHCDDAIISHDMTRLKESVMVDINNLREHHMRDASRIARLEKGLGGLSTSVEHIGDESTNALDGLHTLAKCIDDIKVELERVKTDMVVMKFALTTHMGMSHEPDK